MTKSVLAKLNAFFSKYEFMKMKRKEYLLRNTDTKIEYVYFLTKGYVRQCFSADGDEIIFNIYKPHAFFPIVFILNDLPNTFNYRALTDVEYYRAPRRDVVKFIQKNPDVLLDLTTRLGLGLNRLQTLITFLRLDEARSRVYGFLWLLATRFGSKNGNYFTLDFPMTHKEIASLTGLRRETVSREMSALEKSRKVKVNKRRIWVHKQEERSKLAKAK